jgi:orotidine-5'-phosphate decarboxylase
MGSESPCAGRRAQLSQDPTDRLIFPLDVPTLDEASALIEQLHADVGVFKVGLELFTSSGPRAVEIAQAHKRPVFLDLKLYDIPATVERAVRAAVTLGVRYLTVHASAGPEALQRAARAAADSELTLLAITMVTSADDALLQAIGMRGPMPEAVSRLAQLAVANGVHGLVCSAAECVQLRRELGDEVLLVTPGVRLAGGAAQDQKRVATPSEAIRAGADLIVVGRPIRDAPDPNAAARSVVQELARAL